MSSTLLPNVDGFPSGFPVSAPPPYGFAEAGTVTTVKRCSAPPRAPSLTPMTPSKKAGLLYQAKVAKRILADYPDAEIEPWFWFENETGRRRYCSMDVIVSLPRGRLIIETKLSHTPASWWQLRKLYEPVLRHFLPRQEPIMLASIVKNFDPAIQYPEPFDYVFDLNEVDQNKIAILRWK